MNGNHRRLAKLGKKRKSRVTFWVKNVCGVVATGYTRLIAPESCDPYRDFELASGRGQASLSLKMRFFRRFELGRYFRPLPT